MKSTAYFDGQDVEVEDLEFDTDGVRERVLDLSSDEFGANSGYVSGGFVSGGAVTVNGGSAVKVDITAGFGYCADGERFNFGAQTAVVIPDLTGGNNYIVASYTQSQDTPVTHPTTGVTYQTRNEETTSIVILSSYTPGQTNGQGHAYVPIALVVSAGLAGPLTISDLRVFPKTLGPNTVNTGNIVDRAVIASKLADYLKPIVWNTLPDFYIDLDTNKFRARNTGSTFTVTGGSTYTLSGLPLTLPSPLTVTQVVVGALSGTVCTLSLVPIGTFVDFSTLANLNVAVMGYITIDGIFVQLQSSENSEIVQLAEEEANTNNYRSTAIENIWRRRSEGFQSFTPTQIESASGFVAQPNANKVITIAGPALQVGAGVSYVAGRRLNIVSPVTLTALNTEQFSILSGTITVDVFVLRIQSTGLYRFRVQTTSASPVLPAGEYGYKLATVVFTAGVPGTPTDTRTFSPNPEAAIIYEASQMTKGGARLKNHPAYMTTKIVVEPGIIGFPDGQIRINTTEKILDFTQTFNANILSASQSTGALQSLQAPGNIGLEKYSHYAIFATANHNALDFNLVAVKVPFLRGVAGSALAGNKFQYTLPSNAFGVQFVYPGQKVRGTVADYTAQRTVNNSGTDSVFPTANFTSDQDAAEEIINVTGNVVTTQLNSVTALPNPFSGGTFTVADNFQPDYGLTGITNYRLLGFVSTDGNTGTPILRRFNAEGDNVLLLGGGTLNSAIAPVGYTGTTNLTTNLDLSNFVPVAAKHVKLNGEFGGKFTSQDSQGICFNIGPADGTPQVTVAEVQNTQTQYPPSSNTSVSATWWWAETKLSMGVLTTTVQLSGNTHESLNTLSLNVSGYIFDVKNEWVKQLVGGGFSS